MNRNSNPVAGRYPELTTSTPPPVRSGAIVRESVIESLLVRETKRLGGMALKLVCPGMAGIPDRLVLGPGGRIAFVELKAPGRRPTLLQEYRATQLRGLGFRVEVVDSTVAARRIAREVCRR
jgi:hypothetical protein